MQKGLVIIPTYNESSNIEKIINIILAVSGQLDVLVIDDNSPDNTAQIIRKMKADNPRMHLLTRPRKMGLGTAYVMGFDYALKHDYDYAFEMDADFSHDPIELP
ncbi:MAG: glycosyltransferase, partial [candidate division WOR-3 bacterium]